MFNSGPTLHCLLLYLMLVLSVVGSGHSVQCASLPCALKDLAPLSDDAVTYTTASASSFTSSSPSSSLASSLASSLSSSDSGSSSSLPSSDGEHESLHPDGILEYVATARQLCSKESGIADVSDDLLITEAYAFCCVQHAAHDGAEGNPPYTCGVDIPWLEGPALLQCQFRAPLVSIACCGVVSDNGTVTSDGRICGDAARPLVSSASCGTGLALVSLLVMLW